MMRGLMVLAGAAMLHAGAPSRQALWVYPDQGTGANTMTDPTARAALVENAAASDVTDLYVSVYQSTANSAGRLMYPDSDMADLIQRAHAQRLRVWASYGNPDWPADGCAATSAPLKDMAMVVAYNAANPTAHFDGVVLDIEPPEPQNTAQYQALLAIYQCIQASLPQKAHERLEMAVSIQFSWTTAVAYQGTTKPVYEHIIDMDLANVIVMGYRNTAGTDCSGSAVNGIICLDEPMVAYAKDGMILAGVDTNNCVPGCGPSEVTFFSSPNGQADLNQQVGVVANYFGGSSGFGGFAVYAYELSYLGGTLPGWPSVNTGFPVVPHFPMRR
ncbi:MAG TPA: hypothetical protein VK752_23630 [Bryobacteraceae bacterium]|jgi:hypothetical protein|nr:hypothetical protein [Bryobacteraceae bacterium]